MNKTVNHVYVLVAVLLVTTIIASGCYRGRPSEKPPIHLVPNMDQQPRYNSQSESNFFLDGASMRAPVEGTVARGELHEDVVFYTGKNESGEFVEKSPVPLSRQLIERGRQRFNIYCSPCHGLTGAANGIVVKRGLVPPTSYHLDRLVDTADGYIFDVMSNGIRNMPAYKYQVPVYDRWAIIAYLRVLQRAQQATEAEVPVDRRMK